MLTIMIVLALINSLFRRMAVIGTACRGAAEADTCMREGTSVLALTRAPGLLRVGQKHQATTKGLRHASRRRAERTH
jgi:hypothetical protein